MEAMTMPILETSPDLTEARRQAVGKAGEMLNEPVIVAWKDDRTGRFGPEIPGAAKDRWHEYGESNAGSLEVSVGNEYHFIFAEAADVEEPELNLSNITQGDGTTFLCLNDACAEEDCRRIGQSFGGGTGDR